MFDEVALAFVVPLPASPRRDHVEPSDINDDDYEDDEGSGAYDLDGGEDLEKEEPELCGLAAPRAQASGISRVRRRAAAAGVGAYANPTSRQGREKAALEGLLHNLGLSHHAPSLLAEHFTVTVLAGALATPIDRKWLQGNLHEMGLPQGDIDALTEELSSYGGSDHTASNMPGSPLSAAACLEDVYCTANPPLPALKEKKRAYSSSSSLGPASQPPPKTKRRAQLQQQQQQQQPEEGDKEEPCGDLDHPKLVLKTGQYFKAKKCDQSASYSKYKGVTRNLQRGNVEDRWTARITVGVKLIVLGGAYSSEVDAAIAYARAAEKYL